MSGVVYVDGVQSIKPGTKFSEDCEVEIRGETLRYVSRGGFKLEKALDDFAVDPTGLICIDCGASTGGFTDCLLQRGAAQVYAVDVGYGQLAWSLRVDSRVVSMERTNIRYVTPEVFLERFDLAVMDLSFISLGLILPVVKRLLQPEGQVVCLVKPQFEAGKDKVGKKGVVRDKETHIEVIERFLKDARRFGFITSDLSFSPIRGPEGNIEYLAHLKLSAKPDDEGVEIDPVTLVDNAHEVLSDNPKTDE